MMISIVSMTSNTSTVDPIEHIEIYMIERGRVLAANRHMIVMSFQMFEDIHLL